MEMSATGEAESEAPDEAPYGHKVFEPGQELVSAGQRTGGDEFERRWELPCRLKRTDKHYRQTAARL